MLLSFGSNFSNEPALSHFRHLFVGRYGCRNAAVVRLPAHTEIESATRVSGHRVRAKGRTQPLQNRAGIGAILSFRGPRIPGMPVLL